MEKAAPFAAVLSGDKKALLASGQKGLMQIMAVNHRGMSTEEPGRRGGCHRAAAGNSSKAPRPREATTTFMKRVLGAFVLAIFVLVAIPALAVEGGLGRPISGMSIAPFAGVVPPEPGLAFAAGETYLRASSVAAEPCQ